MFTLECSLVYRFRSRLRSENCRTSTTEYWSCGNQATVHWTLVTDHCSSTKEGPYPAFFRIFVPMRNNFRTVPVGSRFIWS
jgi:transposase InsO family protein